MAVDHQRTQHLFKKLSQLLGQCASRPHPEAVHDLRTISRRVEALLDALSTEPDRNQRKLMRRLKRLRRRAGRVRDIDVQIIALRTLKIGRDSGRKAQLARHLNDRRSRRERKLQNALDTGTIRDLRRRLTRCERALLAPPPAPRPATAAAKAAPVKPPQKEEIQPVSLALRMFATVAKQQGAFTETTLHRFRTRSKRVRYVAEMAGDDPEATRIVSQIKRMQDAIGDWHDWLTLTQTAQKLFADPVDSALIAALRNVTRAKFVEATRHASDLKRNLLGRAQAAAKAPVGKAPVAAKAPASHRAPRPRPRLRRAPAKPKPAAPPVVAPLPEAAPGVAPEGLQPHNFPLDKTSGSR